MSNSTADYTIDLNQEWLTSLKTKVKVANRRKRNNADEPCTIFQVPTNLRDGDPTAYDPKFISLGPYHSSKPHLQHTHNLKLRYVKKILERNRTVELVDYLKLIKSLESQARSSYSDAIEMGSNEFVEMLLVDTCFLVELLLMQTDSQNQELSQDQDQDPVVTTSWALPMIEQDMLILENQIPFLFIEHVFDLATRGEHSHSLVELLISFFSDLLPRNRMPVVPKFYHVLHFFHSCIVPDLLRPAPKPRRFLFFKLRKVKRLSSSIYRRILSSFRKVNEPLLLTPESIPRAITLKEAGVKLKQRKSNTFLEVAFVNGVLEIPKLRVFDHSNSLFRNLIAFEQCLSEVGTFITTYALFMDCLVNTGEDVALLAKYGCIVNERGNDEEAAMMFNSLCQEVTVDYASCYLVELFRDVTRHCESRWNKWRAKLMHDYFSNPWAMLSLAGALVLIMLTVVQSWFSVVAYVYPPN